MKPKLVAVDAAMLGTLLGAAAPFSDTTTARAREVGLTVETFAANKGFNEYLSCCCADHATFPVGDGLCDFLFTAMG